MPKSDRNPMEEDVLWMSEEYEAMVFDFLEQIAPVKPWWTETLSTDEQLWRWNEVRQPIIEWLVQTGVLMGMQSWDEIAENLEDFWFGTVIVDVVPIEQQIAVPKELLMIVQSGPNDAAPYIRKMEKEVQRRAALVPQSVIAPARPLEQLPPPAIAGSVLRSGSEPSPV